MPSFQKNADSKADTFTQESESVRKWMVALVWWTHLIRSEAEVIGNNLPVAESAREVVYNILIIEFVVLIQILFERLFLLI